MARSSARYRDRLGPARADDTHHGESAGGGGGESGGGSVEGGGESRGGGAKRNQGRAGEVWEVTTGFVGY